MIKNEKFWSGMIWLAVTGIVTYNGLCLATGLNVFLYGAWAGVALANAVIRFDKAYREVKEKSAE